MKIYTSILKHFGTLGLTAPQPFQKHPFHLRNLLTLFAFGLTTLSYIIFALFGAETISEYAESFFVCSSMIFECTIFTILLSKTVKLFDIIQNIEGAIGKREFQYTLEER